jgi:putative ABC transport system substrate-binding protein
VSAADPVRTGLVASLSRPEANVTGVSLTGASLEGKRLELLHDLVPRASRLAALVNPNYPAVSTQISALQGVTARLGLQLLLRGAATASEIDSAFADFAAEQAGAVLIANDPFLGSQREQLGALALRHRLPAMSFRREFTEVGGLLSYGADFADGYREAGVYAGRILKGAKATELPVLQPTRFELVINMRSARALGLDIPGLILAQADELLE